MLYSSGMLGRALFLTMIHAMYSRVAVVERFHQYLPAPASAILRIVVVEDPLSADLQRDSCFATRSFNSNLQPAIGSAVTKEFHKGRRVLLELYLFRFRPLQERG